MRPLIRSIWLPVFILSCLALQPSYAFLGFKGFWFFKPPETRSAVKVRLEGQKVRSFKLQQAEGSDLITGLTNYLDSIHSQGSLVYNEKQNELVATDDPVILQRLEIIIKEIDQKYDNPNPKARQILASQEMMKSIRALAPLPLGMNAIPSVVSRPSGSLGTPMAPTAIPDKTLYLEAPPPTRDSRKPQILDERPPVRGFQLVGWMSDETGVSVMLQNAGQRYVYSHGKVRYGSIGSKSVVPGLQGVIQGKHLILVDEKKTMVSLNMVPGDDSLVRIER